MVTDSSFLSGETFAGQTGPGGLSLDLELHSRLAELELSLDSQEQRQEEHRGLEEKQNHNTTLGEDVKGKLFVLSFFIQNVHTLQASQTCWIVIYPQSNHVTSRQQ